MKNLCKSLFCYPRAAVITMCIIAAAFPQPAEAFWWVVAKKVVSQAVKPDIKPKRASRDKQDRASRAKQDEETRDYDGYNPYHAHPDGERSPYFNERGDRGW